jgi:hypothetical protein
MHYTDGDIYFYSKGEYTHEKGFEMAAHIEACGECAEKLRKISAISSIIKGTPNPPPAMTELLSRKRLRTGFMPAPAFKNTGFAIAATLLIAVSTAVFFGKNHISKEKEINFVYKTYASIYNYDYYEKNYSGLYDITFSGGDK